MDPLSQLPTEIRLAIVKLLPDVTSLSDLIIASRAVAYLFDAFAVEITEHLWSASIPKHLHCIIRSIALIRSSSFSCHSLQEFTERFIGGDAASGPLDTKLPPEVLRRTVTTASKIRKLTRFCLRTLLCRVNSTHAARQIDREHYYSTNAPREFPKGIPFEPKAEWPPSWIEELRVHRAFWRLQLCIDLEGAGSRMGWSDGDLTRLRNMEYLHIWDSNSRDRTFVDTYFQEILCVSDFIRELVAGIPNDLKTSVSMELSSELFSVDTSEIGWTWESASPQEDEEGIAWKQSSREVTRPGFGWNFFRAGGGASPTSPLRESDFYVFRRLGLGIWDLKRMATLQLLNAPAQLREVCPPNIAAPKYVWQMQFIWRSIELTEKDKLRAKNRGIDG